MRFWDSSALVPLLLPEPRAAPLFDLLDRDAGVLVWWATRIECASAVARREREGALSAADASAVLSRLRAAATAWQEILPVEAVRVTAERLLRVHPLRTADSLQLAAAVVAAEHDPASLEFVTLDDRLAEAATREGFPVVRP